MSGRPKGYKMSEESKQKIGLANLGLLKGIKKSAQTIEKIKLARKGRQPALGKTWKISETAKENHRLAMIGKNVGRKFSEEHKLKISKTLSGDNNPMKKIENRIKISNLQKGEKSRFWKGGVSTPNELARKSMEYREWRKAVFKRDDWTCQICNARGVKLQADHIKMFAHFPELRFAIDNGRTLCIPCHKKTPTYGMNGSSAIKYLEEITNAQ